MCINSRTKVRIPSGTTQATSLISSVQVIDYLSKRAIMQLGLDRPLDSLYCLKIEGQHEWIPLIF